MPISELDWRHEIMSGEHILVVEDDQLVQSILQARLRAQGYKVTQAGSVTQALHATSSQAPDLMILDLTLLDGDPFAGLTDGLAFLSLLRRTKPEAAFPVIIYSVDDSPAVQARARALGVCAVLKKGGRLNEVLDTVRHTLDGKKAAQPAADQGPLAAA
jgi:DNA-binding response OmpR family regulator